MSWNKWIRQSHRWISIAFTVLVIANFVALSRGGTPPAWITYSPLLPLALLLLTGLYLFVLPYVARRRRGQRVDQTGGTKVGTSNLDRELAPGTKVQFDGTGKAEVGVVVHCWMNDEIHGYDCHVAFFGDEVPAGTPSQKPYVLRYASTSLKVIA